MLVSIIVPLFNKESSIRQTLDSILNQTHSYFEIVLIDDGSTDSSASIVKTFKDKRIHYYYQDNAGVVAARNNGSLLANGDFVMYLDADDFLLPNALNSLLCAYYSNPKFSIYCGNYRINYANGFYTDFVTNIPSGVILNPYKLQWWRSWDMRLGSFIMKRELMISHSFKMNVEIGEDVMFVNELFNYDIYYVSTLVMSYNKEYSELSSQKVNVFKTYSWNNKILNRNFFKILSNCYDLGRGLYIQLRNQQIIGFALLLMKNIIFLPLVPITFIIRKSSSSLISK